jgi:hypothetical protein
VNSADGDVGRRRRSGRWRAVRIITSRYRVLVSKEQYDRTVAYIRQLQAKSTTWSVEL